MDSPVPKTTVEILDTNLNVVTQLRSELMAINKSGTILRYSKELSDFGKCQLRLSTYDPTLLNFGDITTPHQYHLRIRRDNVVIWQGAIIENTKRTKDYIDVLAVEYEWYLSKILINRNLDQNLVSPTSTSDVAVYRRFNSGTMASAVSTIMSEVEAKWSGTSHLLAAISTGTVENPNYPPNMTDGNNPAKPLTGAWNFGDGVSAPLLQYDFQTVLYVLKSFAAYTYADFYIDESLKFNFVKFQGNDRHYDVNFVWGRHGNAIDFNLPRLGQRQFNDLYGIASDANGKIYTYEQTDQTSIHNMGLLEGVAAYSDVKDQATLNARLQAELPLISNPEQTAVTFTLDGGAYPLGLYDIGDIVNTQVNHTAINYSATKRIVGISVDLNSTGRELTTVQLNTPLPWQYGAS